MEADNWCQEEEASVGPIVFLMILLVSGNFKGKTPPTIDSNSILRPPEAMWKGAWRKAGLPTLKHFVAKAVAQGKLVPLSPF